MQKVSLARIFIYAYRHKRDSKNICDIYQNCSRQDEQDGGFDLSEESQHKGCK